MLDEDAKYARDLFKQYLSVNSSKEYMDVKNMKQISLHLIRVC